MEIPEVRYARSGDVSIAYQVFGDGPDLVQIRGWMGELSSMWDQPLVVSYSIGMAEFSRSIVFDKRGTGMSDRMRAVPTLEARMDDVRVVMDAARSERAVLSSGGEGARMSVLFAATYPERVSGIVLVNPSARGLRSADYPWARTQAQWRRLLHEVEEGWGTGEFSDRLLRELAPTLAEDAKFRAWWLTYLRRSLSPGAAVAFYRMMMESDVTDVLPSTRAPTLIFYRDDQPGPAEYFAQRLRQVRLVELSGLRDEYVWARPDLTQIVFRETRKFVAEVGEVPEPERVLTTVLFTDIVGSTERVAQIGDRAWRELLEDHNALIRRELTRFQGEEVDSAGDGVLATFNGPARAIRCASAIRDAVRSRGLEIRCGLHTGECERVGAKVAGIAVHTGARVAALAGPGEVLVSQTVKDLVAGSGIEFVERGIHSMKGVPGEWRLYLVTGEA